MSITKRILSLLATVSVMLSLAFTASAQTKIVKGVVIDDTDMGVIAAAVMIKGTTTGVATDLDGNFEISCKPGDILVISSVGFDEQEVEITDKTTTLRIKLAISENLLDEVVMIGYGTTRAKNFTGSVDVVKMEESPVADLGLTQVSDMLRGRLSGVQMGSESARAGSSSSIQVRGRRSIGSTSSSPLLVVNGVIYPGGLEDIDPNSIESISVLKDATSLAAYGSKAANGVIMITLKKGKEGKPRITLTTSQQFQGRSYTQKVLSPEGYIKYMNARNGRADLTDTSFMSFLEKANYEAGKTTDWLDIATQVGHTQNYNVNFSGRTQNSNYYISYGRTDQKGILKGDEFARNNFSMNVSTHINDNIEISANAAYTNTVNDSNAASLNLKLSPFMEPYLPDGKTLRYYIEGNNATTTNPLWDLQYGPDKLNTSNNLTLGGNLSINIPWIEGLNFRVNYSYRRGESKNYSFTHENYKPAFLAIDVEGRGQSADYYNLADAQGSVSNSLSENWVLDNILSYSRAFGQHYVSGSLVYTRDSAESTRDGMSGSGFAGAGNTIKGWYGLGNADKLTITSPSYSLHTDVGYLARVMYSYKDTYHLNASLRRDGSSVFGAENKWGNFPAFGGAWTISNEDFMKSFTWLDMLKLKASWGMNGAQTISPYGTLSTIALAKDGGIPNFYGGKVHYGQKLNTLGNPTLAWQTTTSWNGGFEADLFKGRFHIDVNAYHSATTDQIFNRNIPVMTAGITTQKATMGQVDNNGLEININTVNIKNSDLTWTSDVVFTLNRNKLVDLYGDGQDDVANGLFLGRPLSTIYWYETKGIFQEGIDAGRPIYIDANGNPTNNPKAEDKKFLGSTDENFRMSFGNTLRWKDFQFYVMFQGIFGGAGYGLADNSFAYKTFDTTAAISAYDIPFWTAAEPNNTYPGPNVNDNNYRVYNSYAHVRLQDISVSYDLKALASKLNVSSAKLTLSGRNLFYIAPNWKMSDPSARSGNEGYLPRTCTLGVNLTF